MAGALLIPGALSLLTQAFPDPRERAQAIGIWASSNATALIAGPVLGGVLVAHFSWQSIFLINLPLARWRWRWACGASAKAPIPNTPRSIRWARP